MGPHFGAVPDPNVQTAERESRSFRRIEGGNAAKAAEASHRESTPYQKSFGITLQSTGGAKFELEKHPTGPGEASPFPTSSSNSAGSGEAQETPAGITKKLFRKLLRS
jgi:hypothetical protein